MTNLTLRLKTILSELENCKTFADVGCDHGYVANQMLLSGKCDYAIVTDVSATCLKKAETLLSKKHKGKFDALVRDGLKGVPKVDQVLIAGMGGELICDIISNADFLPETFVLQPMKNAEKVRELLIKSGYRLIKDYTFKDEKYYDLIVCKRGEDFYTQDEIVFGRDNLKQKGFAFKEQLSKKLSVLKSAYEKMSQEDKQKAEEQIKKYTEILK